jgi:hypothetical protein
VDCPVAILTAPARGPRVCDRSEAGILAVLRCSEAVNVTRYAPCTFTIDGLEHNFTRRRDTRHELLNDIPTSSLRAILASRSSSSEGPVASPVLPLLANTRGFASRLAHPQHRTIRQQPSEHDNTEHT